MEHSFQVTGPVSGAPERKSTVAWTAELDRALLDFLDENKSLFANSANTAKEAAVKHLSTMFPDLEPQINRPTQIDGRLRRLIGAHHRHGVVPTMSPFYRLGSKALDYRKLKPGTYTDIEIEIWKLEHEPAAVRGLKSKVRKTHKEISDNEYGIPAPQSNKCTDSVTKAAGLDRLHELRLRGELKSTTNKKLVKDGLNELTVDVASAVDDYLVEIGIGADDPFQLDFELRGEDLCHLIDIVAGPSTSSYEDYQTPLFKMTARQRVTTPFFVRALVMAAVTDWALVPLPQGETKSCCLEAQAFNDLLFCAPDAMSRAYETVLERFLTTNFKPSIQKKAITMSKRLNHALLPLLAPMALKADHDNAPGRTWSKPSSSIEDGIYEGAQPKQKDLVDVDFVEIWMTDLRKIFEKALDMRRLMEYQGGRFTWLIPKPGNSFDHATMTEAENDTTNIEKEAGAKAARVFLTLCPSVFVSDQKTYGGDFEPEELAARATVVLWTPKTAHRKVPVVEIGFEEDGTA